MADSLLWLEPKKMVLQNAAVSNADGESFNLGGKYGSIVLQVAGTFSATINFEATYDGINYVGIKGINLNTGNGVTSTTTSGVFAFSALGIYKFRARISGYVSGAVNVTAVATAAGIPATTGTVAIDQTTPGVSNAVQLTGSYAIKSGQQTVAAAGTRVALGGDQEYKEINIIAKSTNTGNIYIGDNTVTSSNGAILPPGGYVVLQFVNTNEIYIDADVSGEGVSWVGVV